MRQADRTWDLAVVGAGFVGAAIARAAVRRDPGRRVVLIDGGLAGGGAVARSSAMLMPFGFDPAVRRMTADSLAAYDALEAEAGTRLMDRPDFAWIVGPAEAAALRERLIDPAAADAPPPADPRAWFPRLALAEGDRVTGGPDTRRGRPAAILDALIRGFLAAPGAALAEGRTVAGVAIGSGGVILETAGGPIRAARAAVSVGAWLPHGPFAGAAAAAGIRSKKVASFHLPFDAAGPGAPARPPIGLGVMAEEVYLMPEPERRRWLLSVTSPRWDVAPDAGPLTADAADWALAGDFVRRRLGLEVTALTGASVFADAYSADRLPVVCDLPGSAGRVAVATGTCGYGLKVAPALAAATLDRLDGPGPGAAPARIDAGVPEAVR